MFKYIGKRLLAGVISIVVLITIAFFMMHAMPGGPFSPDEQKNVPEEILNRLAESYGLNKPLGEQYIDYWKNLFNFDLGISYKYTNTSVNDKIAYHFPTSALVGGVAVLFSLIVGIPLGVVAALHRKKPADYAVLAFATIGISIPAFILAVLLMMLFGEVLKLPIALFKADRFTSYILPVLCLSFHPIAYIARQTRSSMLEALENDYVRTARAKGVSELMVVCKHALKNALTPVVTYLGPLVAGLLTGSFVVEKVYSIPGIGRYFVTSVGDRDYTMILGIVIFYGLFVVVCNLVSDILLALIDPRVTLDS